MVVFTPIAAKIQAAKSKAAAVGPEVAAAAAAAVASAPGPTAAHKPDAAAGGQPSSTAAGAQPSSTAAAGGQPPSTVTAPPTAAAAAATATAQDVSEAAAKAQFESTHGGRNRDQFFKCSDATQPSYGMEVTTRDGRVGHLSFVSELRSLVGSCHPALPTRQAKMRREEVKVCVGYGMSASDAKFTGLGSTDRGEWVALKGPFVQSSPCGIISADLLLALVFVLQMSRLI